MWNPDGAGWRAMPEALAEKFKEKAAGTRRSAIVGVALATLAIRLGVPTLL